jgi:hypothetical protein
VPLKTLYTLFSLAVLMFVAKPFIGFSIENIEGQLIDAHSLLAKSFTIRKPDDLNDAKSKASSLKYQLTNPPENIFLTIAALLGILFPVVSITNIFTGNSFLNSLKLSLTPPDQPYLLTGKLTI